jgi:hypothetical protein
VLHISLHHHNYHYYYSISTTRSSSITFTQNMKKATSISQVTPTGATHSFSQEEKEAFCDHINEVLKNDPHLAKILPISSEGNALFEACKDGKLLWYVFKFFSQWKSR